MKVYTALLCLLSAAGVPESALSLQILALSLTRCTATGYGLVPAVELTVSQGLFVSLEARTSHKGSARQTSMVSLA